MTTDLIATLRRDFTGELITPEDSDYAPASAVFAATGAPALVLRPHSADDVAAAVRYARDNNLVVSVRSGGHHISGYGTNTGGVVIDLAALNGIEVVDEAAGTVRIGPGAVWGDVAAYLQGHGLGLTSGDTKSVGVGGLTLGGGIGWIIRKYGLTIDRMLAADVVTADGTQRRASETEHPDLFWALRGGGGNFGVVTSFEFAAFPLGRVYAGTINYPIAETAEVLRGWRDYIRTAPEELTSFLTVFPGFADFPAAAQVMVCYAGDDEAAARAAIEPLRHLGTVISDDVTEKDYVDVLEEAHPPPGIRIVVKNLLARNLSDELVDLVGAAATSPQPPVFQVRSLNGALNRVPADATAFAHRDSEIMIFTGLFLPPTSSDEDVRQALKPWSVMAALGDGVYANFVGDVTDEDVAALYPPATFARLAAVKQTYDPGNLFNQNINVQPAGNS